jgi:hypothetical protein
LKSFTRSINYFDEASLSVVAEELIRLAQRIRVALAH